MTATARIFIDPLHLRKIKYSWNNIHNKMNKLNWIKYLNGRWNKSADTCDSVLSVLLSTGGIEMWLHPQNACIFYNIAVTHGVAEFVSFELSCFILFFFIWSCEQDVDITSCTSGRGQLVIGGNVIFNILAMPVEYFISQNPFWSFLTL